MNFNDIPTDAWNALIIGISPLIVIIVWALIVFRTVRKKKIKNKHRIWSTADNKEIRFCDLTKGHLINIYHHIQHGMHNNFVIECIKEEMDRRGMQEYYLNPRPTVRPWRPTKHQVEFLKRMKQRDAHFHKQRKKEIPADTPYSDGGGPVLEAGLRRGEHTVIYGPTEPKPKGETYWDHIKKLRFRGMPLTVSPSLESDQKIPQNSHVNASIQQNGTEKEKLYRIAGEVADFWHKKQLKSVETIKDLRAKLDRSHTVLKAYRDDEVIKLSKKEETEIRQARIKRNKEHRNIEIEAADAEEESKIIVKNMVAEAAKEQAWYYPEVEQVFKCKYGHVRRVTKIDYNFGKPVQVYYSSSSTPFGEEYSINHSIKSWRGIAEEYDFKLINRDTVMDPRHGETFICEYRHKRRITEREVDRVSYDVLLYNGNTIPVSTSLENWQEIAERYKFKYIP